MPKSKKTIPIYEYQKKVNGQTRYYIRPYIDGKQITKRLDDNGNMWLGRDGYDKACREIKQLDDKQEIKREKIEYEEKSGKEITIYYQQLKEKYLEESKQFLKESSYISYQEVIKNQLDTFFNQEAHSIINRENILKWHEKMGNERHSINYKNKCHTVLSQILRIGIIYFNLKNNYEEEIGQFKENKNLIIYDKEKIRYITKEEFEKFISIIKDPLWYTVFYMLYYTGMRKGELLALTWEDILFEDKVIKITKTYTDRTNNGSYKITSTKNYQSRLISMNESLTKILLEWYQQEKKQDNFNLKNFVFGKTKPLSTTTMTNKKNKYFAEAKMEAITIHEFRHSHVSLVINEGIKKNFDMNKIFLMLADRMGHTLQVMQETYMHLFPNVQTDVVVLLNDL